MQSNEKFGLTIHATKVTEREATLDSLYDFSASFWDNYRRGPRPLTHGELKKIETLSSEVRLLEKSGAEAKVRLFGKEIRSPVGVAAGPAPNFLWLQFFSELGYDILTFKTVRDRYWEGHHLPNLLHVDGSFAKGFQVQEEYTGTITNSLGMPSAEPAIWKREARKVVKNNREKFVAVSVTATVGDATKQEEIASQFASLAAAVKETGADAVELNLSCPNVGAEDGGEIFTDSKLCGRIMDDVRARVGSMFPVLLKTGYLRDYLQLVEHTWDGRVGYSVINAMAARVTDGEGRLPFADRGGRAGICGAPLEEYANRAVRNLQGIRNSHGDFHIFAVGGVSSPETAKRLLRGGADVVETAMSALCDPCFALSIRKSLLEAGGPAR